MNTRVALALVVVLLAASIVCAAEIEVTEVDNQILALVLKDPQKDGGYTVVRPETRLWNFHSKDAKELAQNKKRIAGNLQANGTGITELVDQLFERNKNPVQLTIKSSPKDGYVVDFNGKYAKYFEKDGGGWKKWYKENPKAHGITTVSLPAYDEKTGLVLVYTGTQSYWLAGSGWINLYRYEKGELRELQRLKIWTS